MLQYPRWLRIVSFALLAACRREKETSQKLTISPARPEAKLSALGSAVHEDAQRSTKPSPFSEQPTFTLPQIAMGFFATGLAAADFDSDGDVDLLVSNGNDMSPQVLTLFSQQSGRFPPKPSWVSEDADYQFGNCLGDVDGDGRVDVGVAMTSGRDGKPEAGGFKLYLNQGGVLSALPAQRISGQPSFACQFADVNADGALDLVLGGPPLPRMNIAGGVRVYLNEHGHFASKPVWSNTSLSVGDVAVGDVNADGWLDLALAAAPTTALFFGHAPDGKAPFGEAPDWSSSERYDFQYSIAIGFSRGAPSLAVSASCLSGTDANCNNAFALYQPQKSTTAAWVYHPPVVDPSLHFSKLALSDVNADGELDLLTTSWRLSTTWATPMPWRLFYGNEAGTFEPEAGFTSRAEVVGEELLPVDLFRGCMQTGSFEARVSGAERSVFTAPKLGVTAIRDVKVLNKQGQNVSARRHFESVPGGNWLAVTPPLAADESVSFKYEYTSRPDVAVANWSPSATSLVYVNTLPCTTEPQGNSDHVTSPNR